MTIDILGQDIKISDDGDIQFSQNQDFAIVKKRRNLRQAVLSRLKTFQGEYFIDTYGSDLHTVEGQPKNDVTKSIARSAVFEALTQEPRIRTIRSVQVEFDEDDRDMLNVSTVVIPIDENVPLNLVFDLFI